MVSSLTFKFQILTNKFLRSVIVVPNSTRPARQRVSTYLNTGYSTAEPTTPITRSNSSRDTITFDERNFRRSFRRWLRHELIRVHDHISKTSVVSWEEAEKQFGTLHHTLKTILNRTYSELERNINTHRFERVHAAHRFKVKLDISSALNSAKQAQIHAASRVRFQGHFSNTAFRGLMDNIKRGLKHAFDMPYRTRSE